MQDIRCPKCGAISYLEKDTQSSTGWKCSRCQLPCVIAKLTQSEKEVQLKKDNSFYPENDIE